MKIKMMVEKEFDVGVLLAEMNIRYWEDGFVNGKECNPDTNPMPHSDGEMWSIGINIESGIIEDWPEGVESNVHFKVCDDGVYSLFERGENSLPFVVRKNYYVPNCLCPDGGGYGDYVIMKIDGSGKIENWNADINDLIYTADD